MKSLLTIAALATTLIIAHADDFAFAFEGDPEQRQRLEKLQESTDLPALKLEQWMNSEALDLENLKGKVVVLDFWAT